MRYFIQFSYDGTNYFGFQRQPNQISIQQVLEEAISVILRKKIEIVGAGRTDTGVHALIMYAHFDFNEKIEKSFVNRINSFLPKDISVNQIREVLDSAHARFDAKKRTYKYYISINKNPFKQKYHAQYFNYKFDLEKINRACEILKKNTDFKSFSKLHSDNKTNICKIYQAVCKKESEDIVFIISADRFLRNMVRAIVGTLVDIGRGKIQESEIQDIIDRKHRCEASASAPAKGLFLVDIVYPKDIFR